MRSKEFVVLLHGFNKGPDDMNPLFCAIKKCGFSVFSPKLPALFGTIEACALSLNLQIYDMIGKFDCVHFVAHSMGGLIAEKYLFDNKDINLGNRVYIATPFKGAGLASIGIKNPIIRLLLPPLEDLTKGECYPQSGQRGKMGIISGSKCNLILGNLLLTNQNDGRVEVQSTEHDGMSDQIILHYGHKEIHHKKETIDQVLHFLKAGLFQRSTQQDNAQNALTCVSDL